MVRVSLVLSLQRKDILRARKLSTKFSLFNRRFSRTAVKNSGFQGFQPFSTQSVEKNSTAVFRAAINIPGLFHGFNTPYYYYENS